MTCVGSQRHLKKKVTDKRSRNYHAVKLTTSHIIIRSDGAQHLAATVSFTLEKLE